jgi:hypothetical protein
MTTYPIIPADCLALARSEVQRDGYTTLPVVFSPAEVDSMLSTIEAALEGADPAIRGDDGAVYAARNVLQLFPDVATAWRRPPLPEMLYRLLGPCFGLVRVLYFDKPPGQSWALPWHKDLTIAVRDNRLPSKQFRRPTRKAGVPHVEASQAVLESMLTARIHLDAVSAENGPMKVVAGSHHTGKPIKLDAGEVRTLYARVGDVLLIRPLVAHCSIRSIDGTDRHRRILHLEFAASPTLPDGFDWHDFVGAL